MTFEGGEDGVLDDEAFTVRTRRLRELVAAERALGWATVELDRAESEVVHPRGWTPAVSAPDDVALGARTRVARSPDDAIVVLLEPFTEGRLAASLVRFGEGFVVEYVVVPGRDFGHAVDTVHRAGLVLSTEAAGPFGRQRLVVGGPAWGPHLILAAHDREPGSAYRAGTIEA